MAKFKWFRFYNEVIDDPKVQRLSPSLFRTWVNLLCVASDGSGKLPSIDDLAFKLRMSVQDVQQHVDDLVLAGLLDILPDGICPHNWDQRQFTSDSSTERVRKHRRNKEVSNGNVSCAVSETPPDTDSDSEANTEEVSTPLPPKGGPTQMDALRAFESYNALAIRIGIPQAAKLTPDRQRKIIARLRDYGLEGWDQALANVERSSFLTGTNDRGWRASLEFLLQAASFAKVHDGGYGNGRHSDAPAVARPVSDRDRRTATANAVLKRMMAEAEGGAA